MIQRLPLIERTEEASGRKVAERTPSVVQAERLARALGTSVAEMFAELERNQMITASDASGRRLD
jgi:hypothetical protein